MAFTTQSKPSRAVSESRDTGTGCVPESPSNVSLGACFAAARPLGFISPLLLAVNSRQLADKQSRDTQVEEEDASTVRSGQCLRVVTL